MALRTSPFIGMSMDTTRTQMMLAVLEGVAYGMRDSLEVARSMGIVVKETCICGGGAKSLLWRRIIANVLNIRVKTLINDEGPALGGAILAAVGDGVYGNVIEASEKIVGFGEVIEPDERIAGRYEEGYAFYKKLYPHIKDLYR